MAEEDTGIGDLIFLGHHVKEAKENTSSEDCFLRDGENLLKNCTDA
jgi:hypothetical protein